jgi:hypothetical protein
MVNFFLKSFVAASVNGYEINSSVKDAATREGRVAEIHFFRGVHAL